MQKKHCCHRRICRLESTAAAIVNSAMQITVIPILSYYNYREYILDLCLSLPANTGSEPVSISDGTNIYAVMDTNGQPVVCGSMPGHRRYKVRFGAGGTLVNGTVPPHFTVFDGLCDMRYSSNAALQDMNGQEG